MRKGLSTVFAFILGALFIAIIGVSFYLGTKLHEKDAVDAPVTKDEKPILVGGDTDIHGCIGSAGYSWCEGKQKCLRTWEETCESVESTPTVDETTTIINAVRAAIVAKRGTGANDMTYTVSKVIGNYAQGGAAAEAGGGMWFAAKIDGKWILIWDGNGVILCSDLTDYPDLPTTMIPECFNDITKKSVVR